MFVCACRGDLLRHSFNEDESSIERSREGNEFIESFRDDLARSISEKLGFELPIDFKERYPGIAPADWIHKVDILIVTIQKLIDKYEKI